MKTGGSPGKDWITIEVLKTGGNILLGTVLILLNKRLNEGKIPMKRELAFSRLIEEYATYSFSEIVNITFGIRILIGQ